MKPVKENMDSLSEAASLLLKANTKFLQGDMDTCRKNMSTALMVVKNIKRSRKLLPDIKIIEQQLSVLHELIERQENGFAQDEKSALPLKIEAQLNLLRAYISRGNIKAAEEGFERLLAALPPCLRCHPGIAEIEKILHDKIL